MIRPMSILGAPSSAGAYAPGQEKAPAAWRRHGLLDALEAAGRTVSDRGDIPSFRWRTDPAEPKAMNIGAARQAALAVAEHGSIVFADGHDLLVLGGDCTVGIGTVAAARKAFGSVGLIYLDGDVDLVTPAAGDGALDWTGVTHMLAIPDTRDELAGLGDARTLLEASDVLFLAPHNITAAEQSVIDERGMACIDLDTVRADAANALQRVAEWAVRFDAVLVHLDIDVLDFTAFPIAENTRRGIGLTLDELGALLDRLGVLPNLRALTITEVNPDHAPDEEASFGRLVEMTARALGRAI